MYLLNFIYTYHFCFIKKSIYHLKRNWPDYRLSVFTFLKMFENFRWKSLAIVKLKFFTNPSLKISWFAGTFEAFILRLKCHKPILLKTSEWLLPIFHLFAFFFLNFVNRAEGIWSSDNEFDVRLNLKRNEMLSSLTWKTLVQKNIKKQKRLVFRLKALFC